MAYTICLNCSFPYSEESVKCTRKIYRDRIKVYLNFVTLFYAGNYNITRKTVTLNQRPTRFHDDPFLIIPGFFWIFSEMGVRDGRNVPCG